MHYKRFVFIFIATCSAYGMWFEDDNKAQDKLEEQSAAQLTNHPPDQRS